MLEGDRVTADDVTAVNRERLLQLARAFQILGWVLLVAGAVVALSWAWITVRAQMQDGPYAGFRFGDDSADSFQLDERVDLFATTASLLFGGVAGAGLGAGLVLGCAWLRDKLDDSLVGLDVGDPLAPSDDDDVGGEGYLAPPT